MSNEEIVKYCKLLTNALENKDFLTEGNKDLVGKVLHDIDKLVDGEVKLNIEKYWLDYYKNAKQTNNMLALMVAENYNRGSSELNSSLDNTGPKLALVKKEDNYPLSSSKSAFVNIAILLYGVLNIGFIVAVALMK